MVIAKVRLNDFMLSDIVRIESINTGILPEIINESVESPSIDGERHVRKKVGKKIIPIKIRIPSKNLAKTKRMLAGILYSKESVKLFNSLEPDIYYKVHLDGNTDVERLTWQSPATLYFIAYDGLAHSIEEKTFTFSEPTYKTQPTKYKKGDTWLVSEDVPVTIKSDFAGKLAGSEVECPHSMFHIPANLTNGLPMPNNTGWSELVQSQYDAVEYLDNQLFNATHAGKDIGRPVLIPFNILSVVKRAYPELFEGVSTSEERGKMLQHLVSVNPIIWAKGSGPNGNKVSYQAFYNNERWVGSRTSTSAEISRLDFVVTKANLPWYINYDGIMYLVVFADPSDGTTPSSVSLDYTNVETSLLLPLKGKLMIATKDSDSFDMADWELHEQSNVITVENKGTYKTPISIYTKFLTDTDTIGFVSDSNLVQLGTAMPPEIETIPPLEQIFNNPLKPQSTKDWQVNVGRIRWRENDPNYQSKRQGSFTWGTEAVSPKDYGPKAPEDQNGYWHGPTLTHYFGQNVDDFDSANRFSFRSPGAVGKRAEAQGLFECNYVDADNNFVMGFEIKDNLGTREHMTCHFFVGDARIPPEIVIPKKAINKDGSFFGSIQMRKTGSEFFFRLTGLKLVNGKLVETWALQKRIFNETVAMLSVARLDTWFSQWKNYPTMAINFSDSKFWKLNTIDLSAIPNYFYKNDEVEVDGYSNRVLLNGIQANDYRVLGSDQIFWAEPGKTDLHVATSGLVDVELRLRERFL